MSKGGIIFDIIACAVMLGLVFLFIFIGIPK